MQLFQGQMEEIDARLVEAEQIKSNWTPVQDLVIDSLSEQLDELKVVSFYGFVNAFWFPICLNLCRKSLFSIVI